jgi:hypothetical protein
MSKQRGQQNRDKFAVWVSEMEDKISPNWIDYWHGNSLSPKKIADELGFDSSAFKKSRNEELHKSLEALKLKLAEGGIYHQRNPSLEVEESSVDSLKLDEDSIKDSKKIRDLKTINRRLQAENARLSAEVSKVLEFKEVLVEMGLWK